MPPREQTVFGRRGARQAGSPARAAREAGASRHNTLLVDAAIAGVLAALVLILAPGLAVVGVLALVVLIVWVCTVLVGARRTRRREAGLRRLERQARVGAARGARAHPARRPPRGRGAR